ncbi:MAG: MauE/DoxX family redox-associated membrane protein [Desulfobacterales bacterium]
MPIKPNNTLNRNRTLPLFARLILGGVFVYAGFVKILHPASFAEAVYRYQILPDIFINLTAVVLPWLEFFLGTFLVLGFWMPGSVILSNILLVCFLGASIFNVSRGLDISCGCFSTAAVETSLDIWTILRDASFLGMAVFLLYATFFSKDKTKIETGAQIAPGGRII